MSRLDVLEAPSMAAVPAESSKREELSCLAASIADGTLDATRPGEFGLQRPEPLLKADPHRLKEDEGL